MITTSSEKNLGLHPVYAAMCEEHAKRPPISSVPIAELRAGADAAAKQRTPSFPEVHTVEKKITVNGREIDVIILRPLGTETTELPVILYLHGGGWVFCSRYTHGKAIHDLCIKGQMAVVFVEYSLAPEATFPIAHEECYSTLQWLVDNHASLYLNPNKIALAGDSAGANIVAGLSIVAKQRGLHAIKAQVLIYPPITGEREKFESYHLYGNGDYMLTREEGAYFSKLYFVKPVSDLQHVFASPDIATKEELSGLPPTLVITAECDILRDEGEAYARQLTEAGVDAAAVRIVGTIHSFFSAAIETPQYLHTLGLILHHVNRAFSI
ncbi:hypothetical protein EC973_004169 [Apophysomyces ossiformis]|uniref:Alpha/beta hydrolase fold-3 domain-containing protein n=1 Tax=Apophysomyces ossiformis TaxID=679940 RepID=A0A8H7EQ25_9FUNG|nr:hypothetical protein EC973_004169 [Apophysomyces ossiformis]